MDATYTESGAIKIAVSDPTGAATVDESVSVTIAAQSAATGPDLEKIELLRSINDKLTLLTDHLLKARL